MRKKTVMKKMAAVALAVVTAASLGACGQTGNAGEAGDAGNANTETEGTVSDAGNEESTDSAKSVLKEPVLQVDESKTYRVIMDGDIGCEVDDQYAIVYALMSAKFDVVGLCSEQWGNQWSETSMMDGYECLEDIVEIMDVDVPICKGATTAIADDGTYEMNEASQLIIDEAMKDEDTPLLVLCTGTMTNVAIAYLEQPEIADRITVIGNSFPTGGWYMNLHNDYNAVNVLMDSNVEWYLTDAESESSYKATLTSLHQNVKPCGAIGEYLYERTIWANEQLTERIGVDVANGMLGQGLSEFELRGFVPNGEVFELNDLETVARALSTGYITYEERDAIHMGAWGVLDENYVPVRKVKVITSPTDVNCFMQDFYDKMEYNFAE